MTIEGNYRRILDQIEDAAARSGRAASSVRIIAVTKTAGRAEVDEAYEAGLRDFGENRVQDALRKFEATLPSDACLHLIGSLQTNKARDAVRLFSVIHSLDRIALADALQTRAERIERDIEVLLQVNIAGEMQKHGCSPDEAGRILEALSTCHRLRPVGLMTIAPLADEPEATRPVFRGLRELRDRLQERFPSLSLAELSMGMTNDYVVAVEEGATMVRIGRAIFAGSPAMGLD